MIELVFVIVVLGILAAIAIPRLAATRDDAQIAKGRSDVAAVRSAIVSERQGRLLQGNSQYINQLHNSSTTSILFDGNGSSTLLQYGIQAENKNGHWRLDNGKYVFKVMNVDVPFTYTSTNGKLDCNTTDGTSGAMCKALVQ